MALSLADQLEFLRIASTQGVNAADTKFNGVAPADEIKGLAALPKADLETLYRINKAVADIRVGLQPAALAGPNNNFFC